MNGCPVPLVLQIRRVNDPRCSNHFGHVKNSNNLVSDAWREGNRCILFTQGFGHIDYQFDKQAKVSQHRYTACCPSPFPSPLHFVSSDLRGQMFLTHHSLDIADCCKVWLHLVMVERYLERMTRHSMDFAEFYKFSDHCMVIFWLIYKSF